MAKSFTRLTLHDREELAVLRGQGKSFREISKILGFSHTSLSREFKRLNKAFGRKMLYSACASDYLAKYTRRQVGRKKSLSNPILKQYVTDKIKLGWSPEIISGRLGFEMADLKVSHETIYQFVYDAGFDLVGYLPRRHCFRKPNNQYRKARASAIPNRLALDQRPPEANQRIEFGHWEADLMVSGKSKVSLNVIVERLSRLVRIKKIDDGTAGSASNAVISSLCGYNSNARRSITYDNGTENVRHETVNQILQTKSYFCAPYHSWEKGSVENMNGLIRRYIPKKTDLAIVTAEQIRKIETDLNNRPKKCLDYRTPNEVFNSYL